MLLLSIHGGFLPRVASLTLFPVCQKPSRHVLFAVLTPPCDSSHWLLLILTGQLIAHLDHGCVISAIEPHVVTSLGSFIPRGAFSCPPRAQDEGEVFYLSFLCLVVSQLLMALALLSPAVSVHSQL